MIPAILLLFRCYRYNTSDRTRAQARCYDICVFFGALMIFSFKIKWSLKGSFSKSKKGAVSVRSVSNQVVVKELHDHAIKYWLYKKGFHSVFFNLRFFVLGALISTICCHISSSESCSLTLPVLSDFLWVEWIRKEIWKIDTYHRRPPLTVRKAVASNTSYWQLRHPSYRGLIKTCQVPLWPTFPVLRLQQDLVRSRHDLKAIPHG